MISHYLGSTETAMLAITLFALGRDIGLSFTVDGEKGQTKFNNKTVWEAEDLLDCNSPAFQIIVALRDAQNYLGLQGPSIDKEGQIKTEALLVAADGSVYKVGFTFSAVKKKLEQLGFQLFTETARNAGDTSYDEEKRVFNLRGTARYVIDEQKRIEEAVHNLSTAATKPNRQNAALSGYGRSVRETFEGLKTDFRNSDSLTEALCEHANKLSSVIGARHVGAGWGGMAAVWVNENKASSTIKDIYDFLGSENYRMILTKKGFSPKKIDDVIEETRKSIRLAVPGPAAGIVLKGPIINLIDELSNPKSKACQELRSIYGIAKTQLKGKAMPRWKKARERYLTFLKDYSKRYPEAKEIVVARCGSKICVTGEHSDAHHGRSVVAPLLDDTLIAMGIDKRSTSAKIATVNNSFQEIEYEPSALEIKKVTQEELRGREWFRYVAYNLHFLKEHIAETEENTDKLTAGIRVLVDGRQEYGAIPVSAGLGSSAALNVATAKAFLELNGKQLDATRVAMIVQDTEIATGMFTGLDDSFAMMGGGLQGSKDKVYAVDMEFMPREDRSSQPVLKAKLVEMPKGLVAILVNTGARNPQVQLEYAIRIDESIMAAYILSHMLRQKYPEFFSQFNSSEIVNKWLQEKYKDHATNSIIKLKNSGVYPWFMRLFYLSLGELRRVGLGISSDELNSLIDSLPRNATKLELEQLLGTCLWNDLMLLGGPTQDNLKKLIKRLTDGMEKDASALQMVIPSPYEKPSILGGSPIFSQKANIIKPTKPTDKQSVLKDVLKIIDKGAYVGSDYKRRLEDMISGKLQLPNKRRAVAVNSGTDALILLLKGADVGSDGRGEVIVPSFTYHATVQAILRCGLKPVFADIDPKTFTLDPKKAESLITEKTGAIMPVDIFGNPSAYDELEQLASKYKLKLIFDSAGSLGTTYKGKPIGNFGDGAAISFSFGKIVQSFGHGGIIIADQDIFDNLNGDPQGILNASMMPEINAIMGCDNLLSLEEHLTARQRAAHIYSRQLSDIPGISFQQNTPQADVSVTHFSIIVDEEAFGLTRAQLKWALAAERVVTKEYFPAQHETFKGYRQGDLRQTKKIADNILCLPVWSNMEPDVALKIANAIRNIYKHRKQISALFNRREAMLRSFIDTPDKIFNIERDLLFNHFSMLKAMLAEEPVVPPEIDIHPSNVCTNNCRFCIGSIGATKTKVPRNMTEEEVHKILQDIVKYNSECETAGKNGIRLVRFTGHDGEPLMSPATLAGMKEALRLGLDTALVTNGLFLDEKARKVVVRGRYVYISLYGGSEESYKAITGNTVGFDHVMRNIRALVKLKQETGSSLNINIGFILQPENYKEVYSIAKKLKEIGVSNIRFRIAMEDEGGALTKDQLKECYDYIRQAQAQLSDDTFGVVMMYGEEEAGAVIKRNFNRCFAYPLIAVIGPDLNVYPCTHRSYARAGSFGSLSTGSFSQIWQGKRKNSFIKRLVPSKSCPICPPQAGRANAFLNYIYNESNNDPIFLSWLEDWAAREALSKKPAPVPSNRDHFIDITNMNLNNASAVENIRKEIKEACLKFSPTLRYSPETIKIQDIVMPSGIKAKIGYIKDRPKAREGEDIIVYKIRYRDIDYDLVLRGRPYTDFHTVIGTPDMPQTGPMDPERIELGIFLAKILGKEMELFCNRVAPTSSNFHYQIIKSGYTTIWDVDPKQWPAYIVKKHNYDPFKLAHEICDEVANLQKNGFECDIFIKYDGMQYRSILIPRKEGNVYPSNQLGQKEDFGTIGSLEMAGYFVSCRNDEGFSIMTGSEGGLLYEDALRELSYKPLSQPSPGISRELKDKYVRNQSILSAA